MLSDRKRKALGELELADSSLPIHSLGTIYPGGFTKSEPRKFGLSTERGLVVGN